MHNLECQSSTESILHVPAILVSKMVSTICSQTLTLDKRQLSKVALFPESRKNIGPFLCNLPITFVSCYPFDFTTLLRFQPGQAISENKSQKVLQISSLFQQVIIKVTFSHTCVLSKHKSSHNTIDLKFGCVKGIPINQAPFRIG